MSHFLLSHVFNNIQWVLFLFLTDFVYYRWIILPTKHLSESSVDNANFSDKYLSIEKVPSQINNLKIHQKKFIFPTYYNPSEISIGTNNIFMDIYSSEHSIVNFNVYDKFRSVNYISPKIDAFFVVINSMMKWIILMMIYECINDEIWHCLKWL